MANRNCDEFTSQEQLRNNENVNLGSNNPSQSTSFFQQAGEGMKNMVQGAATVAQGAVQGATNIAQSATDGAANIAHGTATAVRNNLGSNPDTTNRATKPTTRI